MVLVECALEWRLVVVGGCAEFLWLNIWIVQIIVVKVLLLAPNPPCRVPKRTEQQCATNTAYYPSNDGLS